ncbi:MAG: NAD(P)-dependent oxidoreductase [Dehalococcoidia bacterium]|nr:NAD(P)-dependent oxidoreductase [Dehalococcoidia bacterium]
MKALKDEKILFAGLTGQIGYRLAFYLAKDNEVWGLARFRDEGKRRELESKGIKTHATDLANPDFRGLPDDFTYLIHFAVYQEGGLDFDMALRVNAEGTALLMGHCRRARGALVMSSCAIYDLPEDPSYPVKETDPLGGPRSLHCPTYAVSKMAQEAVARSMARQLNLPTTIARMNVYYGEYGGLPPWQFEWMLGGLPVPVQPNRASICSPIHEDDINYQVGGMLAAASIPATIVNWCGDEAVDMRTYCTFMAEIAGIKVQFQEAPDDPLAAKVIVSDTTRRKQLVGDCRVKWQDGMRRMIAARHPEIKLKP